MSETNKRKRAAVIALLAVLALSCCCLAWNALRGPRIFQSDSATWTPTPTRVILATPARVLTPVGAFTPGPTPDLSDFLRAYPRVDGSTSAQPLQLMAACVILKVEQNCIRAEEQDPAGYAQRTFYYQPPNAQAGIGINIRHSGTHESYVNLIEGAADLILVARGPSDYELLQAGEKGVNLEIRAVALDAFVFLVHTDNPIASLTLDQIRGIYSGKITDWDALGWTGKITPYQREDDSGSQELMKQIVMRDIPLIYMPDLIATKMTGPYLALNEDPSGIAYSVFYYANFMIQSPRVRMLGVNGVIPSTETIQAGTYPLVTEVYAVTRADAPPDSAAARLRDWLLTDEGQAAVAKSGYVPVRP